jgi:hypothetical protein
MNKRKPVVGWLTYFLPLRMRYERGCCCSRPKEMDVKEKDDNNKRTKGKEERKKGGGGGGGGGGG